MFSNLRQGSQVYVLHKSSANPFLEIGYVENTNNMMFGSNPYLPNIPISVTIKVGDKSYPYQNLPANAEVADVTNSVTGETVTIACTKDNVNSELNLMRQKSIEAINSVDYHRARIQTIDNMLNQLNPEQAEKVQREKELNDLKGEVTELKSIIASLTTQLKEEKTSSTKKTKNNEHDND